MDRGQPLFWTWDLKRAVAWLYVQLVDELATGGWNAPTRAQVIDAVDKHLIEPFLLTESTFGTGPAAEAATAAWEARFPAAR